VYDLKSRKYYISANSCGINSILIFLKKDGEHLSYLIDRRSISYNRQSLNKSGVRVTEIKLSVDLKLYDGTILDGIIIDSDSNIIVNSDTKKEPIKMNFMITDVFMLGGKSLITMDYKKKMYLSSLMFEKLISSNSNSNIDLSKKSNNFNKSNKSIKSNKSNKSNKSSKKNIIKINTSFATITYDKT